MTNLLILGDRHKFSSMESKVLNERFSPIEHISYKDSNGQESINQIESLTTNKPKSIILLNTQAHIPNELLSYLVKLESKGISYLSVESFLEKYLRKCYIPKDQTNISFLEKIQPYTILQYIIKRLIDYSSSMLIGTVTLPVMLYAIYRIKKESPGSVIYKQKRVGQNGKKFTCYKFRSMKLDAEKDGAKFASTDDKRTFKWGQIMRRTRIDELPQLWNVIKGDMHLIGPRPERKIWIIEFEEIIPYYDERHIIKPGITGWAQVMYPYGENSHDAKQKLMYDLYYIKYWSPWLEIQTIWKTVMVVLGKKGH